MTAVIDSVSVTLDPPTLIAPLPPLREKVGPFTPRTMSLGEWASLIGTPLDTVDHTPTLRPAARARVDALMSSAESAPDTLLDDTILRGRDALMQVYQDVVADVRACHLRPDPARHALMSGLSPREKEVALLLIQGYEQKEIADLLYVAPATIKNHTTAILRAAKVKNRTALAALVLNWTVAPTQIEA